MSSLLNDMKLKMTKEAEDSLLSYNQARSECPPVSGALLAYLDIMFSRKHIKPDAPLMQQELVYQAGIDQVLMHLRSQNDRQEKAVQQTRTK